MDASKLIVAGAIGSITTLATLYALHRSASSTLGDTCAAPSVSSSSSSSSSCPANVSVSCWGDEAVDNAIDEQGKAIQLAAHLRELERAERSTRDPVPLEKAQLPRAEVLAGKNRSAKLTALSDAKLLRGSTSIVSKVAGEFGTTKLGGRRVTIKPTVSLLNSGACGTYDEEYAKKQMR